MKGIGTDIIEIARIRAVYERHGMHFLNKLFTLEEIEESKQRHDPIAYFSGRFCAKEAIAKALGTGFGRQLSWLDLSILSSKKGKPVLNKSDALMSRFDYPEILVSISHCRSHATAFAIWT